MWPMQHVPYHPYPIRTAKIERRFKIFLSQKYANRLIVCHHHSNYLHFTIVGRETFRKMIQSESWTTICACHKCIVGVSTEYGTFSSSIFSAENHFLFRCSCCCHINFVTSFRFCVATSNFQPWISIHWFFHSYFSRFFTRSHLIQILSKSNTLMDKQKYRNRPTNWKLYKFRCILIIIFVSLDKVTARRFMCMGVNMTCYR